MRGGTHRHVGPAKGLLFKQASGGPSLAPEWRIQGFWTSGRSTHLAVTQTVSWDAAEEVQEVREEPQGAFAWVEGGASRAKPRGLQVLCAAPTCCDPNLKLGTPSNPRTCPPGVSRWVSVVQTALQLSFLSPPPVTPQTPESLDEEQ